MAETKPTASVVSKSSTSVQPLKKSNAVSWLAPVACIIAGLCNLAFRIRYLHPISLIPIPQVVSGQSMKDQRVVW